MPSPDWSLVLPQLVVFALAIVLLFADAFLDRAQHFTWLTGLSLVGYGLALAAL